MSSNAKADVPPDATAATGSAEPTGVAEVTQLAEQASEQAVGALLADPAVAQATERETDAATDFAGDAGPAPDDSEPAEPIDEHESTDDAPTAADDGKPADPVGEREPADDAPPAADDGDSAGPVDEHEAVDVREAAAERKSAGQGEHAGEYETAELLDEPIEMAVPVEMAEPVEFAEPVEEFEPRRRGHGVLFTAGVVLAALVIIGGAIAIVGSFTHGFKKSPQVIYKKSAVFSLRTGECVNPDGQSVSIVSCNTPHDAEVFATFTLPASTWPGDTAVEAAASSGCATRLTGYIDPQLSISLASTYVYPDSVAWKAGTRTVICEVKATSGLLTGSVRTATATAS